MYSPLLTSFLAHYTSLYRNSQIMSNRLFDVQLVSYDTVRCDDFQNEIEEKQEGVSDAASPLTEYLLAHINSIYDNEGVKSEATVEWNQYCSLLLSSMRFYQYEDQSNNDEMLSFLHSINDYSSKMNQTYGFLPCYVLYLTRHYEEIPSLSNASFLSIMKGICQSYTESVIQAFFPYGCSFQSRFHSHNCQLSLRIVHLLLSLSESDASLLSTLISYSDSCFLNGVLEYILCSLHLCVYYDYEKLITENGSSEINFDTSSCPESVISTIQKLTISNQKDYTFQKHEKDHIQCICVYCQSTKSLSGNKLLACLDCDNLSEQESFSENKEVEEIVYNGNRIEDNPELIYLNSSDSPRSLRLLKSLYTENAYKVSSALLKKKIELVLSFYSDFY